MKRLLGVFVLLTVLQIAFVNCGRVGFEATKGSIAGLGFLGSAACDELVLNTYSKTYFPLLSVSCNRCHSNAHGSTDLNTSYQAFKSKTASLIDFRATNPHGDNGINLTNEIAAIKPEWNAGQEKYMECIANANNGSGSGSVKLKVNSKAIPNIASTQTNMTAWVPVEWDLETEVPANQVGKFAAFLRVEARYSMQQGSVAGLEFRNPTMRLKAAGKNLAVSGLEIYFDDELQSNVTTYQSVAANISDTTATPLAPGAASALAIYSNTSANTMVAFEIKSLQFQDPPPAPAPMPQPMPQPGPAPLAANFQSIYSNILVPKCLACHNTQSAPKGISYSTHAETLASVVVGNPGGSPLYTQVATDKMPLGGTKLTAEEKSVIQTWIQNGAKNDSAQMPAPAPAPVPAPVPAPAPMACTFNGNAVASGASVTAYQAATVPAGQNCVSQTRTCTNGTLSGTYTFASCMVLAAPAPMPAPMPDPNGATLYQMRCQSCHGQLANSQVRRKSAAQINSARMNVDAMASSPNIQALTAAEISAIATALGGTP